MKSYRGIKNCDKSNQQRRFRCVNEFVISQLKCKLPWDTSKDQSGITKVCSTSEELNQFYLLGTRLANGEMNDELKEFGCLQTNCNFNSWKTETLLTIDEAALTNNPFFTTYLKPNSSTYWFTPLSTEVLDHY